MNPQFKRLLVLRRAIRAHQHIGMTIKPSDYGLGWRIGHTSTQWTLWTIYIDGKDGFSLFRAIPDISKGIDIEDEKLVIQHKQIELVMLAGFEAEWHRFIYGPAQTRSRDTWEGKLSQTFAEWPRQPHAPITP